MEYVLEKSSDQKDNWHVVFSGSLLDCQEEKRRLEAEDEAGRSGLSDGSSDFRISIDRATMRRIDRKPRVGEKVIYYGPRVFTYRDHYDIDLCEVVSPIPGERVGDEGIVIQCSRFRDRIMAMFSVNGGVEYNSNLFWVE